MRLVCLQSSIDQDLIDFSAPLIVGRSEDADVQLTDRFVSRKHCVIVQNDRQLTVRDLGSRHGTWVNGEQIDEKTLEEGDILTIGLSKFRAQTSASQAQHDDLSYVADGVSNRVS